MKPTVVLVGHVCIDHNISEHASYTSWGSAVLHMAHYLREHTAVESYVIAIHGQDARLHPSQPAAAPTLVYENITRSSGRLQRCRHSQHATPAPLDNAARRLVQAADIIVVAPLLPNMSPEYVREVLAERKNNSLAVLSPQGYFRSVEQQETIQPRPFEEASELLPLFDLVVFSEDDCPAKW